MWNICIVFDHLWILPNLSPSYVPVKGSRIFLQPNAHIILQDGPETDDRHEAGSHVVAVHVVIATRRIPTGQQPANRGILAPRRRNWQKLLAFR